MAYAPLFRATVRHGHVRVDDPQRWREYLQKFEGRRIQVSARAERSERSLKANAYVWGVVYRELSEWSGHTPEEIHDVMRAMFLPAREIVTPDGRKVAALGSTAALDVEAFGAYVDKIKQWAAEQGVNIPDPDEVDV